MVFEQIQKALNGVTSSNGSSVKHPLDPLSSAEIEAAVKIVAAEHGSLYYNTVALWEPRKADMLKWLDDRKSPAPHRVADVIAYAKGGHVFEGLVDLDESKITMWTPLEGAHPLVYTNRDGELANRIRSRWKTFK